MSFSPASSPCPDRFHTQQRAHRDPVESYCRHWNEEWNGKVSTLIATREVCWLQGTSIVCWLRSLSVTTICRTCVVIMYRIAMAMVMANMTMMTIIMTRRFLYCCITKHVLTAHCRLLCDKIGMIRDLHQWRLILGQQWLLQTEGQIRFHFGYPCNLITKQTPINYILIWGFLSTNP